MKINAIVEGEIGSGKTTCIRTLLPEYVDAAGKTRRGAGIEPYLLTLEPGAVSTLGPNMCGQPNAPTPPIHHHYIPVVIADWSIIQKYAMLLNTLPLDRVLQTTDPSKSEYRQFLDVLNSLADFRCDGCGETFGMVDGWTNDRAIVIDGLTGITAVARALVVGMKPILSQPEYNPIMQMIEVVLTKFFGMGDAGPSAILLAHVDREVNPVTGMSGITIHTLGQKLAPRIVKMPDEIIMAELDERGNYTWSTEIPGSILKSRRLPRQSGLAPDFAQLFTEAR